MDYSQNVALFNPYHMIFQVVSRDNDEFHIKCSKDSECILVDEITISYISGIECKISEEGDHPSSMIK